MTRNQIQNPRRASREVPSSNKNSIIVQKMTAALIPVKTQTGAWLRYFTVPAIDCFFSFFCCFFFKIITSYAKKCTQIICKNVYFAFFFRFCSFRAISQGSSSEKNRRSSRFQILIRDASFHIVGEVLFLRNRKNCSAPSLC